MPLKQLQPLTALKYRPVFRSQNEAMQGAMSLSKEELAFAYAGADMLLPVIADNYPKFMEVLNFKGFIQGQLELAERQRTEVPRMNRSSAPVVNSQPVQQSTQTGPPTDVFDQGTQTADFQRVLRR